MKHYFSGYLFGWTYDPVSPLPADPFMSCTWENSVQNPAYSAFDLNATLAVAPNRTWNIAHNFSDSGFFTLTCNMSNVVSHQILEHNVTVYEAIVNFTASPKYFANGSNPATDPPSELGGTTFDMVPLGRNVTFFFNYTQGTFLNLHFYENFANGTEALIANVTVPVGQDIRNFTVDLPFDVKHYN